MKNLLILFRFSLYCFLICITLYSKGAEAVISFPQIIYRTCITKVCYTVTCGTKTTGVIGRIKTNPIALKPFSIEVSKPILMKPGLLGWLRESATDTDNKDGSSVPTRKINGLAGTYYVKVYSSACFKPLDHVAEADCVDTSKREWTYTKPGVGPAQCK